MDEVGLLAKIIYDIDPYVMDLYDVAVLLETLGLSREEAKRMGYIDFFRLAEDVLKRVSLFRIKMGVRAKSEIIEPLKPREAVFHGLAYGMPWMALAISLIVFFANIFGLGFEEKYYTSFALGMILSLIIGGSIHNTVARKSTYYVIQGNSYLALKIYIRLCFIFMYILTLLFFAFEFVFVFIGYPIELASHTSSIFILFSAYWIFSSPLSGYVEWFKERTISYTNIISFLLLMISIIFLLYYREDPYLYVPLLSILLNTMVIILVGIYRTKRILNIIWETLDIPISVEGLHPSPTIIFYEILPYIFSYTLYFLYISLDRLIVWWFTPPFPLTYNHSYEIGCEWAIITIIPILISNKYYASQIDYIFTEVSLYTKIKNYSSNSYKKAQEVLRKAYNNTMMTALLSTLISAIIFQYLFFKIFEIKIVMILVIILFLLVISLKKPFNYPILLSIPLIVYVLYNIFLTEYPINTYFPLFTHMTVSIAYIFLGIYIINDNLLLSMGKIGKTMIHLVVSIILNFAIGFYFASINIFYTPIGLFISSLTLNILSTKLVKNIMKNIDNIYIF